MKNKYILIIVLSVISLSPAFAADSKSDVNPKRYRVVKFINLQGKEFNMASASSQSPDFSNTVNPYLNNNESVKSNERRFIFHSFDKNIYESSDMKKWSYLKMNGRNEVNEDTVPVKSQDIQILNVNDDLLPFGNIGEKYEIYSLFGTVVMEGIAYDRNIDISKLSNGLYIYVSGKLIVKVLKY